MAQDDKQASGMPKEEALREIVMSARVYFKNDRRIDWTEWQHLSNEAAQHGLTDEDALAAAREAIGNGNWSPPLPPPMGSRWSESMDGNTRGRETGVSGESVLEAISLCSTDEARPSPVRLRTGAVINGTYRLEEEIGSGGMGVVWRASHTKLATKVAIKFLKHAMGEESAARFLREARTAAKLESPHIARIFDCAQLETGELFIVMEYFVGMGLDQHLARNGPLPVAEAVDFVLEACAGVAAAHKREIVHRDLKPANLFLAESEDGEKRVKIVDFGLSRFAQAEDGEGLTRDQILLGTPEYAPPEQFGSAMNAREQADIWSLGATLYCLLTGRSPFPRDAELSGLFQMSDLLDRVTKGVPGSLLKLRPDLSTDLEKVIFKCLEKKPEDRYPTVADFALDLSNFGTPHGRACAEEVVTVLSGPRKSRAPADPQKPRVSVLSSASEAALPVAPTAPTETKTASPTSLRPLLIGGAVCVALIAIALLASRN